MNFILKNILAASALFFVGVPLSAMYELERTDFWITASGELMQKIPLRVLVIQCVEEERFDDLQRIFDACSPYDYDDPFNNPYGYLMSYLQNGYKKKVGVENYQASLKALFNKLPCDQESTLKMALRMVYDQDGFHDSNHKSLDDIEFGHFLGGGMYSLAGGFTKIEITNDRWSKGRLHTFLKDFLALLQPFLGFEVEVLRLSGNKLQDLPRTIGWLRSLKFLTISENSFTTVPDSIRQCKQLKALDIHENPGYLHIRSLGLSEEEVEQFIALCRNRFDSWNDEIWKKIFREKGSQFPHIELPLWLTEFQDLEELIVDETAVVPWAGIKQKIRIEQRFVSIFFAP